MKPGILVLSCSLHPNSRSHLLGKAAVDIVAKTGAKTTFFDLRELDLEFADATLAHRTPDAVEIIDAIRDADGVILAMPVYNYDVNSAAKNLLEIGLRAWNHKVVSFLCVAGGRSSYMSVMSFANSLMLDFRCLIVPRFVYATGDDFGDDRLETMYVSSDEVNQRVDEVARTTVALAQATSSIYPVD